MSESGKILLLLSIPFVILLPLLHGRMRALCAAFLSGMCICFFSAYINSFAMYGSGMSFIESVRCTTPIIEECMCLLPLLFYLLIVSPEGSDTVMFGVVLGIGFAVFENACYIAANGIVSPQFILIRSASAGVLHVICGLIQGTGVSVAQRNKPVMFTCIAGMLAFTVSLHSIYNLYVSAGGAAMYVGLCIPLICTFLALLLQKKIRDLLSKISDMQH